MPQAQDATEERAAKLDSRASGRGINQIILMN